MLWNKNFLFLVFNETNLGWVRNKQIFHHIQNKFWACLMAWCLRVLTALAEDWSLALSTDIRESQRPGAPAPSYLMPSRRRLQRHQCAHMCMHTHPHTDQNKMKFKKWFLGIFQFSFLPLSKTGKPTFFFFWTPIILVIWVNTESEFYLIILSLRWKTPESKWSTYNVISIWSAT